MYVYHPSNLAKSEIAYEVFIDPIMDADETLIEVAFGEKTSRGLFPRLATL